MNSYDITRLIIAIVAICGAIVFTAIRSFFKNKRITTKFIVRTAIIAGLATILYCVPGLTFKVPFFPQFLSVHLDEIPLLIGSLAYGPWCGVFATVVKTIIKLPMSSTLCVGELSDLICTLSFIIPVALMYKKWRTFKGALISLLVGTVSQIIISGFIVTFVILNFYMFVMGFTADQILGMIRAVGININSLTWPYMFCVSYPFNAFKDAIVLTATILIYKRLAKLINKLVK